MKDSTHNTLVALVVFLLVAILITFIVLLCINSNNERETICKKIGDKQGLDFLFQENGRCGWGEVCSYQCKFVNSNGDIIIKNVK